MNEQIEALPTIARLAREQVLKIHTNDELTLESWRRPNGYPTIQIGYIFAGIKFEHVPPAVTRGLFFQQEFAKQIKKEAMIEFCRRLLNEYSAPWLEAPYVKSRRNEFQIQNLKNVDRFKAICRSLSEKQYPDAFHIWTGEVNGLPYFLTTDGRFVRPLRRDKKLKLSCKPIFPTELLDELKITDRDPMPFKYGHRYSLSGILDE